MATRAGRGSVSRARREAERLAKAEERRRRREERRQAKRLPPFSEHDQAVAEIEAAEAAMLRTAHDPKLFARHRARRQAAIEVLERLDYAKRHEREAERRATV